MINGRKIIALCLSHLSEVTNYDLVISLNREAVRKGHSLFVYNLCSDLYYLDTRNTAEVHLFDLIDFGLIDVLVIAVETIKHRGTVEELIARASGYGVPVMTIDGAFPGCINLGFDFTSGFERIVRHITDFHGITDIHYMAGLKGNEFSEERGNVIKKVLAEKGIDFNDSMISYGDFWDGPAKEATEKLITENRVPRAIICANDTMAITVSRVLQDHGIKVPEDTAVTGFDGIEDIYVSAPKITSSNCSYTLMGAKVAEAADEIFRTRKFTGSPFVEPEPIIAGSCGCRDDVTVNIPSIMHILNNRISRIQGDNQALSRRSEKIQNCRSIEEVSALFDSYVFADMTCVINKSCTIPSADPFREKDTDVFDDEMCVVEDFGSDVEYKPKSLWRRNMVPDIKRLLNKNCPIVFSLIDYLNVPLGYAVFHCPFEDSLFYCRIPIVINAVNNAIGGYVNNQCQRYLMKRLEEIYRIDGLTGLCNRISFMEEYEKRFGDAVPGRTITAALADLDDLKGINDIHGHVAGDRAIRMVADALKSACPEDALLVRLGGDEMLAVMDGKVSEESIRSKIRSYLEEHSAGSPYSISASVGVFTSSDRRDMNIETLIKRSDEIMYDEKRLKKKARKYPEQ